MNTQKAIESVLWIIQNGESNMYNVWKVLFSAEKYHLNKYGCPITGDRYVAMEFGTVPSWLYDAAKIKRQGIGFFKDAHSLVAERVPMVDYLSQSNLEALNYGLSEYAGLDFKSVKDKNHEELAWKKNYALRGGNESAPIPFEDIIEEDWLKEELALVANAMVL
jgi:hypothetical protein